MRTIQLVLCTQSPLVLAVRHSAIGGATPTMDYIAGTVIRGAFAAALLQQGEAVSGTKFQTLFANNQVRYGNLYPTIVKGAPLAWPLPMTAWSCKHQADFLPGAAESHRNEQGHGVVDTLCAQLDGRAWQAPFDRCQRVGCDSQRERFEGYYVQNQDGYERPKQTRRLLTRTAIDGRWGAARSGALYTMEAIEEKSYFSGLLHVEEAALAPLTALLDLVKDEQSLRLGLGRSRGLGQMQIVEVNVLPAGTEHLTLPTSLAQRVTLPCVREAMPALAAERFPFVVTLYSDAILLDDYGRYQTGLTAAAWRRIIRYAGEPPVALGQWPQSIDCSWMATATRPVFNWRFAPGWRKRTSEELAVVRGAVFVCSALQQEAAAVIALLTQLERTGIGRRRDEGFGEIVVGHPWHQSNIANSQEDLR